MKKKIILGDNIKDEPLVEEPQIIRVTDFNEAGFKEFLETLDKIREARQTIIPIHVDSFGGEVYTLLGMVNLIQDAKETVVTYSGSKAMSCGSILLSCGTPGYRFLSQHATVMIHSVSTFVMGKIGEVAVSVEHGQSLNQRIFEIMSKNAGKKKDYFKKYIKEHSDRDIFLTAPEAIKLGIADRIGVPTISVEVSQKFEVSV